MLRQLGSPVITSPRGGLLQDQAQESQGSVVVTLLTSIGSKIPSSDAEVANLKTDLIRAGFRSEKAVPVFYAARIMSTLDDDGGRPDDAGEDAAQSGHDASRWWCSAAPRAGCCRARSWRRKSQGRQETLRLSLPDALDLLVVSVEAGLGLDQAIQHVARELRSAIPS